MVTRLLAVLLAYLAVLGAQVAHPTANRLPLLHAGGPTGEAPATPAIAFVACTQDASDLTTYTFSSASVGTAAATRITVVGVLGEDSAADFTVSTVTVGGDSATKAVEEGSGLTVDAAMFYLSNSTGTSEDIVVTFSEQVTSAVICVWSVTDANASPAHWAGGRTTGGAAMNVDHFTKATGVSAGACVNATAASSVTWAGLTERADTAGTDINYSAADFTEDGTVATPLTTNCDPAALVGAAVAVVHFGPNAPSDPSRTFVACTADDTNATTYTFSSASVSTAADNRITAVGILAEDGTASFGINTVTVGGDSATEVIDEDGSGVVNSAFFAIPNPAGTAEDIVVTASEGLTGAMVICVWALYDVGDIYPSAPQTIQDDDTASGALVLTHTTFTKGISLGVCAAAGVSSDATWAVLSEINDANTAEFEYSAADFIEDAATSAAATCDWTNGEDATGAAVHFR